MLTVTFALSLGPTSGIIVVYMDIPNWIRYTGPLPYHNK